VTFIAALLAALAINAQPVDPGHAFRHAMDIRGQAVIEQGFVGLEARCPAPYQDETCFAGLADGRLITGP
jgi:hypothetical protein